MGLDAKNKTDLKEALEEIETDHLMRMYLDEIVKFPALEEEKERNLIDLKQKGDESAVKELAESNYRLVALIAKEYAGRGLPYEDLVMEGNNCLIEAVKTFDQGLEKSFSEFIAFAIRSSLDKAIENHKEADYITLEVPREEEE